MPATWLLCSDDGHPQRYLPDRQTVLRPVLAMRLAGGLDEPSKRSRRGPARSGAPAVQPALAGEASQA